MQKLNQMSRYSFLKTDDEPEYNNVKYSFSEKKGGRIAPWSIPLEMLSHCMQWQNEKIFYNYTIFTQNSKYFHSISTTFTTYLLKW